MKSCRVFPRDLLEKRHRRTSVCANTIVASSMPRIKRIWKVALISLDVVARTKSNVKSVSMATCFARMEV